MNRQEFINGMEKAFNSRPSIDWQRANIVDVEETLKKIFQSLSQSDKDKILKEYNPQQFGPRARAQQMDELLRKIGK